MERRNSVLPLMACAALAAVIVTGGCSREKVSPEQQVLRTIAQGLAAVERRDLDAVGDLMAEGFTDSHGHDRRRALGLLRLYFIQNQKIHLFAQTKSIRFPDPRTAEAVVVVAMAGQPIESADAVERLRANIHRFEIRFVSDGDENWRAAYADWRYAELSDMF